MYVYVISNPAFEGWLKVGKSNNPKQRFESFKTYAPTEYQLELLVEFEDDRPLHNKLDALGYERKGEWFKVTNAEVRRVILETIAEFDAFSAAVPTGKNQAQAVHEGVNLTGLEPITSRRRHLNAEAKQVNSN